MILPFQPEILLQIIYAKNFTAKNLCVCVCIHANTHTSVHKKKCIPFSQNQHSRKEFRALAGDRLERDGTSI